MAEDLDNVGVRLLGDLRRIELGPNDRLVLKTKTLLSLEGGEQVRGLLADAFEINRKRVIILGPGAEIGVIGAP